MTFLAKISYPILDTKVWLLLLCVKQDNISLITATAAIFSKTYNNRVWILKQSGLHLCLTSIMLPQAVTSRIGAPQLDTLLHTLLKWQFIHVQSVICY